MANFTKPLRRSAVNRATGHIVALGVLLAAMVSAAPAGAADCRVFLSQPLIDYGQMRRSERSVNLGLRTVRLSVVCPENRVIALRFQGDSADGQTFRFGQQGSFSLTFQHPQLDGKPVELVQLHNQADRGGQLRPGQSLMVLMDGRPVAGRTFSAQVQVDTWLSSAVTAVRDKTTLEGNGRFELVPAG